MLWAPKLFLAMALVMYLAHTSHWIQFSTAFVVVAFIHSRWLPWRFEIRDDGVELRFPFGRHVFLSRTAATVRRRDGRCLRVRRSPVSALVRLPAPRRHPLHTGTRVGAAVGVRESRVHDHRQVIGLARLLPGAAISADDS